MRKWATKILESPVLYGAGKSGTIWSIYCDVVVMSFEKRDCECYFIRLLTNEGSFFGDYASSADQR